MERDVMSRADWLELGKKLYGDTLDWKFQCVSCGHEQTGRDFVVNCGMEGAQAMTVVFMSCEGRWNREVGCDWSLGGLLHIHTREVETEDGDRTPVFLFASEERDEEPTRKPRELAEAS